MLDIPLWRKLGLGLGLITLFTLFNFFAFFPAIASAAPLKPSIELQNRIASVYHSRQTAQITFVDHFGIPSLLSCVQTEIQVTNQDPVSRLPRHVNFKVHHLEVQGRPANAPDDMPTVVIIPPIGGTNQIDTGYALSLCMAGIRAVLIENWDAENNADLPLESIDQDSLRAMTAIGAVVDYLQPRRPSQVGLLGTSAGAIIGALVTGYDSRVAAAKLIVGGGDLADIIATSDLAEFQTLRTQRMTAFGYSSVDQYRNALEKSIQIDPLEFATFSGRKVVSMTIATRDTTVPTVDQYKLYRAFGAQELRTFDGGHVPAVINTALTNSAEIVDFFIRSLK